MVTFADSHSLFVTRTTHSSTYSSHLVLTYDWLSAYTFLNWPRRRRPKPSAHTIGTRRILRGNELCHKPIEQRHLATTYDVCQAVTAAHKIRSAILRTCHCFSAQPPALKITHYEVTKYHAQYFSWYDLVHFFGTSSDAGI